MVVCVAPKDVDATIRSLQESGEETVVLGKTIAGKGVILK
jgi:phosphoribosylaminoimidazole (AIR) synthetase